MRNYYYILFTHDTGEAWRVYRLWFWNSLITRINATASYLEDKNYKNVKLTKIKKI